MSDPRPVGTFCWFDHATTDAAASKAFYAALCNWTYTEHPMGDQGVYTMVHTAEGHDLGGMYELNGPMFEGVPPHFMFYVRVADVDATVARCTELGGSVVMPGYDIPGRGRMAMLGDSEGAKFAVWEERGHCGTSAPPDTDGGFCWTELSTRDPGGATAFYGNLFGWADKTDANSSMPYTEFSLEAGGPSFAGMMKMDEKFGDAPPYWMGYLLTDDCDAFANQATELGAKIVVPPMTIPEVGRFTMFFDPAGAAVSAIQLDKPYGT